MRRTMKNLLIVLMIALVAVIMISCQTSGTAGATGQMAAPVVDMDLEPGDIASFEVIAASTDGRLDITQTETGVQLYGRAAFGNFVQYSSMVPVDGFDLEISMDALENNVDVDNWFAIGLLSRQGFLTGDTTDTSAEGIVLLARMSDTEAGKNIGFQVVKNPGLQELTTLSVPYAPGSVYTIRMKASGDGYALAINDQRAIIGYDQIASDLYRGSKGFLFFATHSDNKGDLRGTIRRIGSTGFAR